MQSDKNSNGTNVEADSDSEDHELTEEESSEITESPTFAVRMLNLCKEFAVFALVVVTYAALTNDPPKVTKSPTAYPFFSKNSIVKDWYRGQISKATEDARFSDITFVMFYAPWSAESQFARSEFEKAARYMNKYVTFTAVNCWQPNSECKIQYSKVYKWPVLVAYPSHGRGIQYTGPLEAMHIIKFLQSVCNPIERLTDESVLDTHDVYVTASLNTLPGSREFAVYYLTALRFLEKEPIKTVKFYITSTSTNEPEIKLHLWNVTLSYLTPYNEWEPDNVLQWIHDNMTRISSWLQPTGAKSLVLSNVISKTPTLILFTPRNPLHFSFDYYDMLQLVSREYFDCGDVYQHLDLFQIKTQRLINYAEYKNLLGKCPLQNETSESLNVNVTPGAWKNFSCNKNINACDKSFADKPMHMYKDESEYCHYIQENCFKLKYLQTKYMFETSMYTGEADLKSPENLQIFREREKCQQFLYAERYLPHMFEQEMNMSNVVDISGLGCKVNRSLSFIVMDSIFHYHFAERLGINLSHFQDKTAAVIVNDKMESHYILKETVTTENLRQLIFNFSNNIVPRSLASMTVISSQNTHSYVHNIENCKDLNSAHICVQELTTETFLPTILQNNKAVLLFYYSKQCAFCSGISHVFLTTARKLSFVDNLIFSRIDGEINLLPWQYTMETYPTIIYFPTIRKSESRVYPRSLPITVPNLLGFLLANLNPTMKLHVLWSVCNNIQNNKDKFECLSILRLETLSVIDNSLRLWRRSNKRQKQGILHKLKKLKNLHLLLAHNYTNLNNINTYFNNMHKNSYRSEDYNLNKIIKDEL